MKSPIHLQQKLDIHHELIVDLFAGGGGMSEGIFMASGRHPDIAINHNDDALSMHRLNHPDTRHFVADVFEVDPKSVTQGRPVGHLHASPDCTHHSQAAGGQPRNEKRRALSWVVVRWAGQVNPRVITLENVKQVKQWGPLIAKRDQSTGRVIKLDGSIAEKGERVPREFQYLIPDPKRKGITWKRFMEILREMGYDAKDTMMAACDFGAGTTRDRLFMHARNDGRPVTFPEPSHFKKPAKGQKKWSPAHEHIDFSIEGKSIFDRKTPLKPNTLKRIAKGVKRFVLDNPDPFIIQITHSSSESVHSVNEPLRTVTTAKGGEFALATPVLIRQDNHKSNSQCNYSTEEPIPTVTGNGGISIATPVLIQAGHGEGKPDGAKRWGQGAKDIQDPLSTITASGDQAVATAYLARMKFDNLGLPLTEPIPTITAGGNSKRPAGTPHSLGIVTAHLTAFGENALGSSVEDPMQTVMPGAPRYGLIECELSEDDEEKAMRVASFLMTYYGNGQEFGLDEPIATITTKDRLALVTVYYKGVPHVIVDIKLRMLEPKELFSAQGFGPHYIITHGHDGRKFSKSTQVRMCGNSVSPYPAAALYAECHRNDDMRQVA